MHFAQSGFDRVRRFFQKNWRELTCDHRVPRPDQRYGENCLFPIFLQQGRGDGLSAQPACCAEALGRDRGGYIGGKTVRG